MLLICVHDGKTSSLKASHPLIVNNVHKPTATPLIYVRIRLCQEGEDASGKRSTVLGDEGNKELIIARKTYKT